MYSIDASDLQSIPQRGGLKQVARRENCCIISTISVGVPCMVMAAEYTASLEDNSMDLIGPVDPLRSI